MSDCRFGVSPVTILILIICKTHEELIKTEKAHAPDKVKYDVFGSRGQVTPKRIVRSGRYSNSFYGYLQV